MDNDVIVSLSFSSYSTNGSLASIAVKITKEFNQDAEDEADDFEFSLVLDDQGHIYLDNFLDHKIAEKKKDEDFSIKIPLSKLFAYDREEYSSSSSTSSSEAEADELEATMPESTYCLWRPKLLVESNTKWKKSNSTGERKSKGSWNKLCDLLRRSNSQGKGPFVSLNQPKHHVKDGATKLKASPSPSPSPLEVFYVRNKAEKEGSKRKSYLPYRQQLVGLFSSVNH